MHVQIVCAAVTFNTVLCVLILMQLMISSFHTGTIQLLLGASTYFSVSSFHVMLFQCMFALYVLHMAQLMEP